ncbi:prealbumin-like fold domain-containing protein [Schaalia sp. JY-X159]|uniref:prealbumin-like fold domain-containing protein n=1 Tax=Schaalia sp. JY-X159 TaxID=2758575 RepID=UPI00165E642A|nr:prealbumin-like fold domain-containing protein [Schaalia sp. JY-X159]
MARRAGPKHSTSVEETYARGRMGALAALATLALVGTGAAGAFAATSAADIEADGAAPAVAMLADPAADSTADLQVEGPAEPGTTEPVVDPGTGTDTDPGVITPPDTTTPPVTDQPAQEDQGSGAIDVVEPDVVTDEATTESVEGGISPFAVGIPDGAGPPYVYWTVEDEAGNLVPGATFSFERRNNDNGWTGTRSVTDCVDSGCTVVDRDSDAGEFLVKWITSNTPGGSPSGTGASNVIQAGSRYRVQPVTAPPGYEWVSSTSWVDSNTKTWVGDSAADRTLDFGTFKVRRLETKPVCAAGYVYAVTGNGQLRQVAPGGSVTNLGTRASDVSGFNGVGIGVGAETAYAYERTNDSKTAQLYEYNTTTGTWSSLPVSVDSVSEGHTVTFVAGGVDLSTGKYYFGGFAKTTTSYPTRYNVDFHLWEYTPGGTAALYKGYVRVVSNATTDPGNTNGDLAFDSQGVMYIVRGWTVTTGSVWSPTYTGWVQLSSVGKDALLNAAGGSITGSTLTAQNTGSTQNVNGIAFDDTGKGFLGSGSRLDSFDMPGWTNQTHVVSTGLGTTVSTSTDLASCTSPPTVTLQKYIQGGRVAAGDEFELILEEGTGSGALELGRQITDGPASGLQTKTVGPVPTRRGVELHFSEEAAGTTDLDKYASSYQCTLTYKDGSTEPLDRKDGRAGSVTIPPNGESVVCEFRNSPLVANVVVNKQVTDLKGENPRPDSGWTVGATTEATVGRATQAPTESTLETDEKGNAAWKITFNAYDDRATVTVFENVDSKTGYEFDSGSCVVTHLDGSKTRTPLLGPEETALERIKPGDQVACTYTNRPHAGTLTLVKSVDGGTATADQWALTATGSSPGVGKVIDGATTGTDDATAVVPAGSYILTESDDITGYELKDLKCVKTGTKEPLELTGDDKNVVSLENKDDVTCTFTNAPQKALLTLVKKVEGSDITGALGSAATAWTLSATNGTEIKTGRTETTFEVTEGTWTLAETGRSSQETVGYDWTSLECKTKGGAAIFGTSKDNPKVNLKFGDHVTCTFTNKAKPGSVTWNKIDEAERPLAGSQWQIKDADGNEIAATITEKPVGTFSVIGLPWGEYTLAETVAPPGYQLLADSIEFKIGPDGSTFDLDVMLEDQVNTMVTGPALPLTGGQSAAMFTILGGGLLAGALALTAMNRRKGGAAHRA